MLNLRFLIAAIAVITLGACSTTGDAPKAVDANIRGIGALKSLSDSGLPLRSKTGVPKAVDVNSGGIGTLMSFGTDRPHTVFLVKADEPGGPFSQQTVIVSNYSHGAFVYALNLEPGTYAAVAAQFTNIRRLNSEMLITEKIVFFEKELIQKSTVTVEPGRITFMGDINIQSRTTRYEDPDAVQEHYMTLVTGGDKLLGTLVKNNNDKKRTKWFLKFASRHLKKGGWSDGIKKQLAEFK